MYPNSNELLTIAEYRTLTNTANPTTYDSFITGQIPAVARAVETYCRRRFLQNTWTQWCSINYQLIADNWPISQVFLIGVPYPCFTITDTSNNLAFSITQANPNNLNVVPKFSVVDQSALTSTDYLFATYTTVGALKTAVEAAHATVTFTYQSLPTTVTMSNVSTLTLRPTNGKTVYFGANYFNQTTSSPIGDIFRLSDNSDRIFINPNYCTTSSLFIGGLSYSYGYGNVDQNSSMNYDYYPPDDMLLVYQAGYITSEVPTDLKMICANILKDIVTLYDLDGSGVYRGIFDSEGLGDYNYKIGTDSNIGKLIDTKYASALDFYKRKVIA